MTKEERLERLTELAVRILRMSRALPNDPAGWKIARQVVGSGTSIVANVEEAIGSGSRKEFLCRYTIALREARETLRWLVILGRSEMLPSARLLELRREADEIVAILTRSIKTTKARRK